MSWSTNPCHYACECVSIIVQMKVCQQVSLEVCQQVSLEVCLFSCIKFAYCIYVARHAFVHTDVRQRHLTVMAHNKKHDNSKQTSCVLTCEHGGARRGMRRVCQGSHRESCEHKANAVMQARLCPSSWLFFAGTWKFKHKIGLTFRTCCGLSKGKLAYVEEIFRYMHVYSCCLSKGILVYLCLCVCMRVCEHTIKTVSRIFALSLSLFLSFCRTLSLSFALALALAFSLSRPTCTGCLLGCIPRPWVYTITSYTHSLSLDLSMHSYACNHIYALLNSPSHSLSHVRFHIRALLNSTLKLWGGYG